ncbi:MAG TPA: ATP phosphoribosyltransferase regulatory subunit, partial [Thermoanaerobaculia bacterium]|nr:ATP phosphoribosyltransferase regulatory subunit [Thermoanaerobaculia bacterium]
MSETVKPRISRGLRDLLPDQMLARQRIIDTVRGVYELYGFVPLSTPAIEYLDVLSGSAGQEAQESIFRVSNPEDEALGLRFDLTVPLARVVAQYADLPRPFRRYQVSPVWRADKPDKGRFREFTQFDLDSVGTVSEIADTEIIAGMCDSLSALDAGEYQVRFSSRAMLNLLLDFATIPAEQGGDVFRVL